METHLVVAHEHMCTAEDLPLNVSRETLQSNKFLKQLKSIITRHLVQTLTRIQNDDAEKFGLVKTVYNNVFKLGAVEDTKNREKLSALVRFPTNQRNLTSLNEVMSNYSMFVIHGLTLELVPRKQETGTKPGKSNMCRL